MNDFTCLDAQCALAELIKIDPREFVDDAGNVGVEFDEHQCDAATDYILN